MDSSQSSLNDDPWIYIDENGTFLKKFGDQNAAAEITVSIIPDPNMKNPPKVRIENPRGLNPSQIAELQDTLKEMTEEDYYYEDFELQNLIDTIYEYLYFRTGDPSFSFVSQSQQQKMGLKTQKKNSKSQQNKNKNTERNAKSGNPLEKIDKLAPREKVKKLFDSVMNSKGDITRAQLILTLQNLTQAERGILKSKIGEWKKQRQQQALKEQQQMVEAQREKDLENARKILYSGQEQRYRNTYNDSENGYIRENIELAFARQWPHFTMTHAGIKYIPPVIKFLKWIQELNLGYNNLTSLPTEISDLVHLKKLILCENQIEKLPYLGTLTELTLLDLRKNRLNEVPSEIGELPNLRVLDLEHNQITWLPVELSLCQKLVHLNLNNNKIVLLPAQLGNITSLEILKLRNCPIKSIPSEIYHKGTQHVLEFLRSDKYLQSPVSAFREEILRMLNRSEYSDIIFNIKNEYLYAHRIVIKARCSVLFKIVTEMISKTEMNVIQLDKDSQGRWIIPIVNADPNHFKILMNYIYGDLYKNDKEENDPPKNVANTLAILEQIKTEEVDRELERRKRKEKEINEIIGFVEPYNLPRLVALIKQSFWPSIEVPKSTFENDFKSVFRDPEFADIWFSFGNQILSAHKVIVVARSRYFGSMLSIGLKESYQKVIELQDITFPAFNAVMEYFYCDDAEVTGECAIDLLIKSRVYGLDRLFDIVETIVGYSIDSENVACIYEVASLYKCVRLKRACIYFILGHYDQVKSTQAWKDLNETMKQKLFKKAQKLGFSLN